MTRRTLISTKLAEYFIDKDELLVTELGMREFDSREDKPYSSIFMRRLFGSWSRSLRMVQNRIDQLTKVETAEDKTTEDKTAELDPLAALKAKDNG